LLSIGDPALRIAIPEVTGDLTNAQFPMLNSHPKWMSAAASPFG
jgi:hypothetical protein